MSVELNERRQKLLAGGGEERVAKQHEAGKMTARERVAKLFDEGSFVEVGVFTAAKESAASVITGYGLVDERPVYVYAQDFTVKSGAMGAAAAAKIVRIMELAQKTGAPVIALCDSNGAIMDQVAFDLMKSNIAYALQADGSWTNTGATPNAAN